MEIQHLDILLRLLIAHLLADFFFQTDKIVEGKKKGAGSRYFILHILIVGLLTYLLLGDWTNWWAPLLIMVLHAVIDIGKIYLKKDNVWIYLIDQIFHLLSILFIWILITQNDFYHLVDLIIAPLFNEEVLIVLTAYLLISYPTGYLIGYLTKEWQDDLERGGEESLKKAGRSIGIIERILVVSFIIINAWAPVGFLLAAKSVFRFGDLKEGREHKKTEYILIGTLLSFTFAIILGVIIHFLITR